MGSTRNDIPKMMLFWSEEILDALNAMGNPNPEPVTEDVIQLDDDQYEVR